MSKQDLSILFWIKRSIARKAKDGKAPISARVTIDGLRTEISLSRKVLPEEWDEENKIVISTTPEAKIRGCYCRQTSMI